jgi:predicted nucleotidyltransferase
MRTNTKTTDRTQDRCAVREAETMVDAVKAKREEILRVARRHGVTRVRVFGSSVRGDAGPQSDVDLLVEVGPEPTPWFPGGLVAELEELLGRRVQVVTERGLDRLLRDRVLQEAVPL